MATHTKSSRFSKGALCQSSKLKPASFSKVKSIVTNKPIQTFSPPSQESLPSIADMAGEIEIEGEQARSVVPVSEAENALAGIKAWLKSTLDAYRSEERQAFCQLQDQLDGVRETLSRLVNVDRDKAGIGTQARGQDAGRSNEFVTIRFELDDEERAYSSLRGAGYAYQALPFSFARVDPRALECLRAESLRFDEHADYAHWRSEKSAEQRAEYLKNLGVKYGFNADDLFSK